MKFTDYRISEEIKTNLGKLGFKRPTDIQFKAIPNILKGEDLLAIAQTGTGKTAAFAIPVIDILHHKKKYQRRDDGIKCVIMAPTRELVIQLTEVFDKLSTHTRVKTFGLFGGVDQDPQIEQLQKGIDILIATPGRLFDLNAQGYIRFNRVEILILDEADHMLALGFIKDIRDLIRYLPRKRQTLFFSATIDDEIKKLAYSLVTKPIRIQISPKDPVSKNVDHAVTFIEMDDKRFFLEKFVNNNPEHKILVFVRTKVRAERTCKAMARVEIESMTLHGDKEQKERLIALNSFKKGEIKLLIATDVSARGIDIPNVDYVINYDLPEQAENYVHRVGRTGRGTQKGKALSFCSEQEKELLKDIQTYVGKPIQVLAINKNDYIDTVQFSEDGKFNSVKSIMDEIEEVEEFRRKNKKKRKKK